MNDAIIENRAPHKIKTFTDNAFFLLANHERILSDSRMRYAPVNADNGLLYSGTSGFKNTVLGVYLEWWLTCKAALVCVDNETTGLIWHLAGSPLSSCNSCCVVDDNGNMQTVHIGNFHSAWTSFVQINNDYAKSKGQPGAYSIDEVIEKLNADKNSKSADRAVAWVFKQICADLRADNVALKKQIVHVQYECERAFIMLYIDEIRLIHAEIKARIAHLQHEIILLQSRHRQIETSQHSGEITSKEAQQLIVPILKEKEYIKSEIQNIENEYSNRLKAIDPHITPMGVDIVLKET